MTPEAKDLLMRALRLKGESLLSKPSQCRDLLKDFAKGGHKREIHCLVTALEIGCVDRLKLESNGGTTLLRRQMVAKLHEDRGVDTELGFWVVETWAEALCWLGGGTFAPLTGGPQPTSLPSGCSVLATAFQLGPRMQSILQSENLSHLEPLFEEHAIVDSVLEILSDSDLRDVGVAQLGERRQLLAAFAKTNPPVAARHPKPAPAPSANFATPTLARKFSPFVNRLRMKFIPVPGTNVLFSIWETRVRDYAAFVQAMGREMRNSDFEQTPKDPVVNVSWEDAKNFCMWLTEKESREGKIARHQIYRLPTDEEWSVAVGLPNERGTTPREKDGKIADVYPWGTQWPPPRKAGNYAPSLGVDSFETTSPVGSFAANRYVLFDMGGNVWEWCEDSYDESQKCRVLRGGSWYYHGRENLLSSCRLSVNPNFRLGDFGFRCVLCGEGTP